MPDHPDAYPVLDATVPPAAVADPTVAAMQRVDAVIRDRLASRVVLIDQISHYIIGAGGKRIRPRLVLLFCEALGFDGPEQYELAAIVEFIHTATLLHDDVVDESALRRGRATARSGSCMFISCRTSPSAMTLVASASTSSTRMRFTETIIWNARE